MRLEQETILAGKHADGKPPATMGTRMITFSRAVIESGVASATTILGLTDSVLTTTLDQNGQGPAPARQKQARPQQMRVSIAPDGSIAVPHDSAARARGMSRAASLIPATFPLKAVAVGEKWTREAPLPAGTTQFGSSIVGWVEATFRLDSLTKNGDLAWISMHGKLHPDSTHGPKTDGVATVDDGTVEGYMTLDRDRGWLVESKFVILAHSTLRQLLGVTSQPTTFEIHLTQTLKTIR
jgi:hypothetical protein